MRNAGRPTPRRAAGRRAAGRLAAVVCSSSLLAAGCGSASRVTASPTTNPPATSPTTQNAPVTPTTTAPSTTVPAPTTTALPADLATSVLGATSTLIDAWKAGDRSKAGTVATPAAVSALFASSYSGQTVILRGCSQIAPVVCSYGPNGGASPALSLYQLTVTSAPGGWYVSSVVVES